MSKSLPAASVTLSETVITHVNSTLAFNKEVGKRSTIGNELRLDPFGFNRISSLRVRMRSAWMCKRTFYSRRREKDGEISHD